MTDLFALDLPVNSQVLLSSSYDYTHVRVRSSLLFDIPHSLGQEIIMNQQSCLPSRQQQIYPVIMHQVKNKKSRIKRCVHDQSRASITLFTIFIVATLTYNQPQHQSHNRTTNPYEHPAIAQLQPMDLTNVAYRHTPTVSLTHTRGSNRHTCPRPTPTGMQ